MSRTPSPFAPLSGLLFDIGDTLLDATGRQAAALRDASAGLAEEGVGLDRDAFVRAYEAADREPQFEDTPDLNHLYSDRRIVGRTFELMGARMADAVVERFLDLYRARIRASIQPDPVVSQVLTTLRTQGLHLGVASNGTLREQLEQLALMGIAGYFDPILISEDVGIRKPDPRIFLPAAERWRLPPEQVAVVGDRIEWDVLGAHRAGMRAILTTEFVDDRVRARAVEAPELVIGHLSELPSLLQTPRRSAPITSAW